MAYPTLAVEVAFDDDPLDTSVTWTNVVAYVRSVRTRVGRDSELDAFEAGTCTLVLNNTDRRFDPLHASGPYYGKLTAGKRVRVTATHGATTYTLFVGWVDGWPQDYGSAAPTITVNCTDAFKQLARMTLPGSVYEYAVDADGPWLWWRFLEQNGSSVADHSGNGHDGVIATEDIANIEKVPTPVKGVDSVFVINRAASVAWFIQQTALYAAPSHEFSVEFWCNDRGINAFTYYGHEYATVVQSGADWSVGCQPDGTYNDRIAVGDVAGNTDLTRTTTNVVHDEKPHHVVVRVDETTVTIYVDGAATVVATAGSQLPAPNHWRWMILATLSASGSGPLPEFWMGEFAVYSRLLSALEILDHYQSALEPWEGDTTGERIDRVLDLLGWPAGLRDIDVGQSTLGVALLNRRNALDYLRTTAAGEQGHLYCDPANAGKVTFRNRHHRLTDSRSTTAQHVLSDEDTSGVVHYDDLDLRYDEADIVNVVEVRWLGGTVVVEDSSSITTYGRSTRSIDTELGSRDEAEGLGQWVLGRYATPTARCRKVVLNPAAYQAAFEAALDLRISDRVTVRKLPQGVGSAIEKDLLVEGIEHVIDQGVNTWTTTIKTSEAEAGPWFVWGTATWGETTRWAW